jgi:hypothetical protein
MEHGLFTDGFNGPDQFLHGFDPDKLLSVVLCRLSGYRRLNGG